MTAVPPRPAAPDNGPHSRACGIRRHDHGPDCHGNCPTCGRKAAPDATTGDGLREALVEALTDHRWISKRVGGVECQCGWQGSRPDVQLHRADALLALPALRDVLAAAARDAERVARVRDIHKPDGSEPHACCECGEAWPCCTIQALDGA